VCVQASSWQTSMKQLRQECERLQREVGHIDASQMAELQRQHCLHLQSLQVLSSWGHTHTHTHPFNGPLSGTAQVSRYQRGKTNLDFAEARDSEWQWHQLGHMQVCTSLQTDNHASMAASHHSVICRPDAVPAAQPTASKH